jgi:hypothetical protein
METDVTQELPAIYQALAAAKAATAAVGKNSRNQQQGFSFRGVDAVVNAAAGPLNDQGVIIVPQLMSVEHATVEVGQKRTPMAHVRVQVAYLFYGPDGSYVKAVVPAESMDSGDKAVPKAMSVAYRIALLQVLNLPTDDRDPDADAYERSPRQARYDDSAAAAHYEEPANRELRGTPRKQARQAAPPEVPPIDEEAQGFADQALAARTVTALREIHTAASLAAKLSEPVRNPGTGNIGGLGKLITWRRQVVEDEGKALDDLMQAAKEAKVPDADVDAWVQKVANVSVEGATAAQLRATAHALRAHG